MQKNSENFSMQDVVKWANSPAGKQLIALLQQSNPAAIQQAMTQASAGNYSQAKQALEPLFASEDVKKLLQQMGGKNG